MIKFVAIGVFCLLHVGCARKDADPIWVLQNTRIQSATLRGPGTDGSVDVPDLSKLHDLLDCLTASNEVANPPTGLPRYNIRIWAAGNMADIDIGRTGSELFFRLDGVNYSGGSSQCFARNWDSILNSIEAGSEEE